MMPYLLIAKDFYWEHRDLFRAAGAILAITAVNFMLLAWMSRRLTEIAHMRERMSRLADGLALLTDTTEAGLTTLIREVEQLGRRKATTRAVSRSTVSKRVAAAVKTGEPIAKIAEAESLSESEVRLHLTMAQKAATDVQSAA